MKFFAIHRRSLHPTLPLVLQLTCFGCAEAPPEEATSKDVFNSRSAMTSAPEIPVSAEPTWTTPGRDVDNPLYRVEDAGTLASGEIAILTQEAVMVYDQAGRQVRTMGGAGKGPGEFTGAFDLTIVGDSLVVFDWPQQRITIFASDGELRDVISLHENMTRPELLAVLDDGSFLFKDDQWQGRPAEFTPIDRIYIRFSSSGAVLDTVGRHPYAEVAYLAEVGVRTMKMFAPIASSAAGSTGFWGTTGGPEVTLYDLEGRPRRTIRWEAEDHSVTSRDVATYVENFVQLYPENMQAGARARMDVTPVADTFPATSGVALGLDGRLWVELYESALSTEPRRWMVFDTAGIVEGWATLPPRSILYEAGAEHVLVEMVDDLGVESVAEYQLGT